MFQRIAIAPHAAGPAVWNELSLPMLGGGAVAADALWWFEVVVTDAWRGDCRGQALADGLK